MLFDLPEWPLLTNHLPGQIATGFQTLMFLPIARKLKGKFNPSLVQERAGFHLGIGSDIHDTSRHSAQFFRDRYEAWLKGDGELGDTSFRNQHFTVAVGGGNTLRNEYKALLRYHFHDIDWLEHVRFFLIEESCNIKNWEPARDTLVKSLVEPLAKRLVATEGSRSLTQRLGLRRSASRRKMVDAIIERMIFPIDTSKIQARRAKTDSEEALREARIEARRYQALLRKHLGPAMRFHLIISGIGKDGGIGAFVPYAPELKKKQPGVIAVQQPGGATCVTLNRGVLIAADCISLIISGSLKLRALGRFELEDSAPFEQTVMETPIRMLRETRDIAERVHIFADDRALHFAEGVFEYEDHGVTVEVKSEVREGDEPDGIHTILVHGFMGLYSYINLLIGLPSAWKVSALRRGKHAKTLPDEEIFPHYANTLREMILEEWQAGRPTPICCHSMAGIISDHLLLSVLEDYGDELPEFEDLEAADRSMIEGLQASGMVHIATWAPTDTLHLTTNMENLKEHRRNNARLNFSGLKDFYELDSDGKLILREEHADNMMTAPAAIGMLLRIPGTETAINSVNVAARFLASRFDLKKLLKQKEAPYGQRLLSDRVLKKVSFYGVLKEVNAAMHDPSGYMERHMKALEAIARYDIPYLAIVHRDDFLVSANRHVEEHDFLCEARMAKEGVRRKADLDVPVRLIYLKGETEEPAVELVDPHFLILSHSHENGGNARKVTAAMSEFVHENVKRAIKRGSVRKLASIETLAQRKR